MWREKALIILVFLLHLIHGEDACPPSSCGKISNISYPFRLKGDQGCGRSIYELSCENNITLFSFYLGTFHVEAINYHNFTIRVVDPGLQQSNCSSLPRYFFSPSNFTHFDYDPYLLLPYNSPKDGSSYETISLFSGYYNEPFVYKHIVFLNCSHPVTGNPKYVDTRGCVNWESNGYIYAMAGDLIAEDFEVGCHVKLVSTTSWWGLDTNTYSYAMMHTALIYGFDLSWIPLVCEDRCADIDCTFSSSSQTFKCYREAWWLYYVSDTIEAIVEGLRFKGEPTYNGVGDGHSVAKAGFLEESNVNQSSRGVVGLVQIPSSTLCIVCWNQKGMACDLGCPRALCKTSISYLYAEVVGPPFACCRPNLTAIRMAVGTYEALILLLNSVSVFDTCIGHRHSYDTCRIRIHEVSNSKNIF